MRLLWWPPIEFGKMTHQIGEIGAARFCEQGHSPILSATGLESEKNDDFSVFYLLAEKEQIRPSFFVTMKLLWIADIEFGSTIHQVGELGTASAYPENHGRSTFYP